MCLSPTMAKLASPPNVITALPLATVAAPSALNLVRSDYCHHHVTDCYCGVGDRERRRSAQRLSVLASRSRIDECDPNACDGGRILPTFKVLRSGAVITTSWVLWRACGGIVIVKDSPA